MTNAELECLNVGDQVYWRDPDGDKGSRLYTIKAIGLRIEPGLPTVVAIAEPSGERLQCRSEQLLNPLVGYAKMVGAECGIWDTGGGCTAFGCTFPDGTHALATDEDGAEPPEDIHSAQWTVGHFKDFVKGSSDPIGEQLHGLTINQVVGAYKYLMANRLPKPAEQKFPRRYTVRVSGTAPVWKDVEVVADSPEEALAKVGNGEVEDIEELGGWELCEGGNGIDDWSTTGDVFDSEGESILEGQ